MTVGELKAALEGVPDDLEVRTHDSGSYSPVQDVIRFDTTNGVPGAHWIGLEA